MLKRVGEALFEAEAGTNLELFVESHGNNGIERASFQYDGTPVATTRIFGHPGCSFIVQPGHHQFVAAVDFDPAASPGARYTLFHVNDAGQAVPLDQQFTAKKSAPVIGIGIWGGAPTLPSGAHDVPRGSGKRKPKRAKSQKMS